jgi:hypothetical protein
MLSVADLLPPDPAVNLTLRLNVLERETLKEVVSGANILAFVPVIVTLLTLRVEAPLFETAIDFVIDDPIRTVPKPTEDAADISGTVPVC